MKKLNCPQCDIQRFLVKNTRGDTCLVYVTDNLEIIPVKEQESLDGFDISIIYCLGCSWSGSPNALKKYRTGYSH